MWVSFKSSYKGSDIRPREKEADSLCTTWFTGGNNIYIIIKM